MFNLQIPRISEKFCSDVASAACSPNRIRRRAFTLIELLVVVSIIAVLAAMLLPAISLVRRQAAGVACINNLRNITIAQLGYVQDFDGLVPPAHQNNDAGTEEAWGMWFGYLFKHDDSMRGNPVFMCPAPGRRAQVLRQVTWDRATSTDDANSMRFHSTSYAVNSWAQELMSNSYWEIPLSRASSPSTMIWMGEVIGCDPDGTLHGEGMVNAPAPINAPVWYPGAPPPYTWHVPADPAMYTSAIEPYVMPTGVPAWNARFLPRFSHGKRMTCAFYDGHVAGTSLSEMVGDGSTNNLWYGSRP